jgi:hypothetical protein
MVLERGQHGHWRFLLWLLLLVLSFLLQIARPPLPFLVNRLWQVFGPACRWRDVADEELCTYLCGVLSFCLDTPTAIETCVLRLAR